MFSRFVTYSIFLWLVGLLTLHSKEKAPFTKPIGRKDQNKRPLSDTLQAAFRPIHRSESDQLTVRIRQDPSRFSTYHRSETIPYMKQMMKQVMTELKKQGYDTSS